MLRIVRIGPMEAKNLDSGTKSRRDPVEPSSEKAVTVSIRTRPVNGRVLPRLYLYDTVHFYSLCTIKNNAKSESMPRYVKLDPSG
jgi:hypothetical protein